MVAEGRSPHIQISLRELLAARQVLNKAINGVLQGTKKLEYAERLARWILRRSTEDGEDRRVTIVSTNYDTTLERPLFDRLIRSGLSVGRAVDFGMPWRDAFDDRVHVRPANARLALIELHGSLNWLRCEQCGHVTVNVLQRIASLDTWDERSPRGFNVCSCDGLLRSILVTPSVVRDVRDANLLGIWNAALEDQRGADEWIFVGYSLPPEDIAIRSVLLRAWHARRRRGLRVRVVQYQRPADPTGELPADTAALETYKRYRLFFPPSALAEAEYRRDGVLAYVDGLDLLPEGELDQRMHAVLGAWTPRKVRQRARERRLAAEERRLLRTTRRREAPAGRVR